MDIDNKQNGQCPKGNWSQNCPSMSSRMFLLSWISAKHMCCEASNKKKYPVNLLNRSRGVLLGAFARRLINSLWPGRLERLEKTPNKNGFTQDSLTHPKAQSFYYFFYTPTKFRKDGQNTAWMWQACKLSRTGWRTGEEVPVGAGILIKSFMTGWWFQIFLIFTPIWGRFPFWRAYFSKGLVQPPTS